MSRCIKNLVIAVLLILNGVVLVTLAYIDVTNTSKQELHKSDEQNRSACESQPSSKTVDPKSSDICQRNEKEPPETFVIPVIGKSMKVSDSLIIFLTGVIAFATIAIYCEANERGEKELRAYVGIPHAKLIRIGTGNIFQIQVTISNSGKTPARNVQKWIAWKLVDKESTPNFEEKVFDRHKRPIAPDSQWLLRETILEWNDEIITAISTYKKSVYVWGKITYTDIYKTTRFAEFRVRTDATMLGQLERVTKHPHGEEQKDIVPITLGWELQPEADGNDMD